MMRSRLLYVSLGFLILLVSCEGSTVTFTEPQPTDVNIAEKFKRKFRGEYLCVSDSSILKIEKTRITQYWHYIVDVDSNSSIERLTPGITVKGVSSDLEIKVFDDSTKYEIDYHHDLFLNSTTEIAKYVGGVYFLNVKEGPSSWVVQTMSFNEDGYLEIVDLHLSPSDIEVLKQITEVSEDQEDDNEYIDYTVKPSRKELEQLLATDLFESGEKFVRIKK